MLTDLHWDEMIEIAYSMSLTEVLMLFTDASGMRWYMYVTYMIRMIDLLSLIDASLLHDGEYTLMFLSCIPTYLHWDEMIERCHMIDPSVRHPYSRWDRHDGEVLLSCSPIFIGMR
jgi:hypothetical protein